MDYNFDIDKIKSQVEEILRYSQGFGSIPLNVQPIIDKWLESKKYFIDKLKGNLIYEMPRTISFELDNDSKTRRIESFAENVENHYGNYELSRFLYIIKPSDFYNNKTSMAYKITDKITVPENYKVVKAFKFFESDPEILHQLQSEASVIIQESIVSGRLCLSVHPLDFLSASENAHNWRSCHALDGEYRTGNLNYLLDENTVICYLRAEKPAKLPHFPESVPWNSKKWRVWMFFSDDKTMLFAGRQYPFEARQGTDLIKKEIFPAVGLGHWGRFYQNKMHYFEDSEFHNIFPVGTMLPVGNTMKSLYDLVQDVPKTYQYNDLLRSTCYEPIYAYKDGYALDDFWDRNRETTGCTDNNTVFHIGAPCPCPICGETTIFCGEIMACEECNEAYNLEDNEDYEACSICGTSVYYQDIIELPYSEERICSACYQRETYRCQECGETDLPEIIRRVPEDGRCLCPECRGRVLRKPVNLIENIKFTI